MAIGKTPALRRQLVSVPVRPTGRSWPPKAEPLRRHSISDGVVWVVRRAWRRKGRVKRRTKRAEKTVTDRAPCVCGCGGFPKGSARWHSAHKRAAARTG